MEQGKSWLSKEQASSIKIKEKIALLSVEKRIIATMQATDKFTYPKDIFCKKVLSKYINRRSKMRSIRYVLKGDPHNLDDCLDLSHRQNPEEVSVELITNEIVAEMYILKQLIGKYSWKFTDRNVQYEEVYGGCFAYETERRQRLSIDNANSRFNNSIRKIENMGIEVIGSDKRFKYSLIYQESVKK